MKICPACQESNHNAAELCLLCGAPLPLTSGQTKAMPPVGADAGDLIVMPSGPPEPGPGTLAIAVYHDAQPRVLRYFPIETDRVLIGREDPKRDTYPDIDLGVLLHEGVSAEHVSRQHVRLTRRQTRLQLEVLPGSTGTQINRELLQPGSQTIVHAGDRIILGGKVRMKLIQF